MTRNRSDNQRPPPAVQDDPLGFCLMRGQKRNPGSPANLRLACRLLELHFVDREVANDFIEAAFGFRPTDRAWEQWVRGMNGRAAGLARSAAKHRHESGQDWPGPGVLTVPPLHLMLRK